MEMELAQIWVYAVCGVLSAKWLGGKLGCIGWQKDVLFNITRSLMKQNRGDAVKTFATPVVALFEGIVLLLPQIIVATFRGTVDKNINKAVQAESIDELLDIFGEMEETHNSRLSELEDTLGYFFFVDEDDEDYINSDEEIQEVVYMDKFERFLEVYRHNTRVNHERLLSLESLLH